MPQKQGMKLLVHLLIVHQQITQLRHLLGKFTQIPRQGGFRPAPMQISAQKAKTVRSTSLKQLLIELIVVTGILVDGGSGPAGLTLVVTGFVPSS
jgi:hypothetical protein